MSYFDSQLGQRPLVPPAAPAQPQPATDGEKAPHLFEARLGACPRPPDRGDSAELAAERGRAAESAALPAEAGLLCPLCRAPLAAPDQRGVWQCAGRCGARWLPDSAGGLLDLAGLAFGICSCCQPAQALARAEGGAVCPRSGLEYLLLPSGPAPRAQAAPVGLCACCAPPAPLARQGSELVCSARPTQRYELRDGVPQPAARSAGASATLAAIDAALRSNSARVGLNGLFDLDSPS